MPVQVPIIREFYAIRYASGEFGARPDLTHPHLVNHPLSEGRYVVQECVSMTGAYIQAHHVMGSTFPDGPSKGRSKAPSGVEVLRVAEHEPVQEPVDSDDPFDVFNVFRRVEPITMTITGCDQLAPIPHFSSGKLSRYCPVNGWVVPQFVNIAQLGETQ